MRLGYILCVLSTAIVIPSSVLAEGPSGAQKSTEDLAKELSNPVARLISVPLQTNYDRGIGPNGNGYAITTKFQPVIPFKLNDDWQVISRTVVPMIYQHNILGNSGTQFGLGNVQQSFFFSPATASGDIIWGVGPIFYLPTATDRLLGTSQSGLGPTAVALKVSGPWTVGILANQIWGVVGPGTKINQTYLQPFVSYTTKDAWTFSVNAESTYNWLTNEWAVPINFSVAKLVRFNQQNVSFSVGIRRYAASTRDGADGWGARASVTLLFPK
jgi:hypothetical protein